MELLNEPLTRKVSHNLDGELLECRQQCIVAESPTAEHRPQFVLSTQFTNRLQEVPQSFALDQATDENDRELLCLRRRVASGPKHAVIDPVRHDMDPLDRDACGGEGLS